jgi:hypothetical protein
MYKLCPSCRGEFQQWVESCPDCGVALVAADAALPPTPPPPDELPPAHELVCVERGDPRALREIAARLQSVGISCRIDGHPSGSFGVYVLPADAEEAVRTRTQLIHESLPELAGQTLEAGTELAECPACGEPLAEAAQECAACGLAFPEAGD